jgi:hypothetical protein
MATSMANPQASAPQPTPQGADAGASQANPLQTTLGKIAMLLKQVAQQNTSVQEPLNQAVQSIVQAIQMSSQAATQQPQQPSAPPQQ